jgi:hypothetical protein
MKAYRMSLISTGSISLDSTFKFPAVNAKLPLIAYTYPPFLQSELIACGVSLPNDKKMSGFPLVSYESYVELRNLFCLKNKQDMPIYYAATIDKTSQISCFLDQRFNGSYPTFF